MALRGQLTENIKRKIFAGWLEVLNNFFHIIGTVWNNKELKTNEAVDLYFIALHKPTNTEIRMPALYICEEYSSISFGTLPNEYDGDYNGIGRLPSYVGNDTADDYEIYVVINGVKCLYRGLQYSSGKNADFKGEWLDGSFYARRVSF